MIQVEETRCEECGSDLTSFPGVSIGSDMLGVDRYGAIVQESGEPYQCVGLPVVTCFDCGKTVKVSIR